MSEAKPDEVMQVFFSVALKKTEDLAYGLKELRRQLEIGQPKDIHGESSEVESLLTEVDRTVYQFQNYANLVAQARAHAAAEKQNREAQMHPVNSGLIAGFEGGLAPKKAISVQVGSTKPTKEWMEQVYPYIGHKPLK